MRTACAILHGCCTSVLRQLCKNEKKEPELQQVQKAMLQSLHPEQVEVESCRFVSELWRLDLATGVLTLRSTTGFRRLSGVQFDAAFHTLDAITGVNVILVLVLLDKRGAGHGHRRDRPAHPGRAPGVYGGWPPGRGRQRRQPLRTRPGHRRLDADQPDRRRGGKRPEPAGLPAAVGTEQEVLWRRAYLWRW